MDMAKNRPAANELMAAIESTSNGVVLVELSKSRQPITFVNPAFERMTGYQRAEIIGQNCRFLQGPETSKVETANLRKAIKERRHHTSRILNYRKDGSTFWNDLTISPIIADDGAQIGFVGIQNDVTAEVLLQRELSEKIDALEPAKQSLNAANAELLKLAHYDPLTGLPSRRLLQDRLTYSLARAKRTGSMVAMAFMDLDGFKKVNDRFGHEIGDLALCQVSDQMRNQIRETDTLARHVGDEFILLFDTLVSRSDVATICDRIRGIFSAPFNLGEFTARLDISIGTAFYPNDGDNVQSLLRFADAAMYESKNAKERQPTPTPSDTAPYLDSQTPPALSQS
jgi:diguanylate cyclase (GGDEF)-like protein/PAS domain S-box-containing protein